MKIILYSFIAHALLSLSCKKDFERDNYHDMKGTNFQKLTITSNEIVLGFGTYPSNAVYGGEFYAILAVKNDGTHTLSGVDILIKDEDGKIIREYVNKIPTIAPGQEIKLSTAIKIPARNGSTLITFIDKDGRTWDDYVTYEVTYPSDIMGINELDLIYESNPDGKINPGETVRFRVMLQNTKPSKGDFKIKSINIIPKLSSSHIASFNITPNALPYTHSLYNKTEGYCEGEVTMTVKNSAFLGQLYDIWINFEDSPNTSPLFTNYLSFTISQ